jgi:hypothetical protein
LALSADISRVYIENQVIWKMKRLRALTTNGINGLSDFRNEDNVASLRLPGLKTSRGSAFRARAERAIINRPLRKTRRTMTRTKEEEGEQEDDGAP